MSDLDELLEHLLRVAAEATLDEIGDLDRFEALYDVEPVDVIVDALVKHWARRGLDAERLYPLAFDAVADALLECNDESA